MKWVLLFLMSLMTSAFGGSVCPRRIDIYPCTCANVRMNKKTVSTIVTCQHIPDTDFLNSLFPALRSVEIDQFYLYDSFWEATAENQMALPSDWISLMKIKELEVIDTTLSPCFACQWKLSCRNSITTKFKVTNSSSHERICSVCDSGRGGGKQSWMSCMSNLTELHFNHGKLTSLSTDFFPTAMRKLLALNLSHNRIVKIDPNTFKNLPSLVTVDLSHNAIEFIDHIFGVEGSNLKFLDVSWNFIKRISGDLFSSVPSLKTLKANNNEVVSLVEAEWKKMPNSLKNIHLANNPLHCDCNIRWINGTFPVDTVFEATCSTPEDYENSPIRRASRFLIQRCDSRGNVGSRRKDSRKRSSRKRN